MPSQHEDNKQAAAASCIQRVWRYRFKYVTTKRLAIKFLSYIPTIEWVKAARYYYYYYHMIPELFLFCVFCLNKYSNDNNNKHLVFYSQVQ